MLTNFELVLYTAGAVILLPLALYGLIAGPGLPENSWLARYYSAERYLNPAGALMLLALWVWGTAKLAVHLDYIDPSVLMGPLQWAIPATILVNLGLWIRAVLRVHRNAGSSK